MKEKEQSLIQLIANFFFIFFIFLLVMFAWMKVMITRHIEEFWFLCESTKTEKLRPIWRGHPSLQFLACLFHVPDFPGLCLMVAIHPSNLSTSHFHPALSPSFTVSISISLVHLQVCLPLLLYCSGGQEPSSLCVRSRSAIEGRITKRREAYSKLWLPD